MSKDQKFAQVPDVDLQYGLWRYQGGGVRFQNGKIFVPVGHKKVVDTAKKK